MIFDRDNSGNRQPRGMLSRLARDRAGNTFAMVAAAIAPLLALVGGGIDMGRSYMSETRLQQACDSGVLAARKKMGSTVVKNGKLTADAQEAGDRFFALNFRDGAYGTDSLTFKMTLESDYSVSGVATVNVPTTIMKMFGNDNMAIEVDCQARLNFSNTDIMFVLDTTGSMSSTNPGDSDSRIEALRQVVKDFHKQIEDAKSPDTRIRYGFVPYSSNVNVGFVLKPGWMVNDWTYQSRIVKDTGTTTENDHYEATYTDLGGTYTEITQYVSTTCPSDTLNTTYSATTTVSTSPHQYWYQYTQNGNDYWCTPFDGKFSVGGGKYTNKKTRVDYKFTNTTTDPVYTYTYQPVTHNVAPITANPGSPGKIDVVIDKPYGAGETPKTSEKWYNGCIEERSTYEIDDYTAVDLNRALDLNIDLVPDASDPATQWAPLLPDIVFARALYWDGTGSYSDAAIDYDWDYLNPAWAGYSACPAPAKLLDEMDESDVANYVDTLYADGSTYHDIGMIWGGRLLSPDGLFEKDNADVKGKPTTRHLIFLTDGETAPLDVTYGTYGLEPLDKRRWTMDSALSLTQVVENRFSVACDQVRKKNVTVWVIGFGVSLNTIMEQCAGAGHYFVASDTDELTDVFSKIASAIGELRISK